MKVTILVVITALGLIVPLLWITGTLTSVVYYLFRRQAAGRKEQAVVLSPQLGLTMADGGDAIEEQEKKA